MFDGREGRRRGLTNRTATVSGRAASRRGATLITVCITITVLLGLVGVGVDAARAYAFKTQLKTITDAAAMAGAVQYLRTPTNKASAETVADAFVDTNKVNGLAVADATVDDIDAVKWNYTTRSVETDFDNDYANVAVNGIRVVARYNVPTTFSRVFGVTQIPITETTVAALGGIGEQSCLRPWAVNYSTVIQAYYEAKGLPVPPGTTSLTPAQLDELSTLNHTITLLTNNEAPYSPGNIGEVTTWTPAWQNLPGHDYNGGPYQTAIASKLCTDVSFSIGDWVPAKPGEGDGQTTNPVASLCGQNGVNFSCDKQVKLIIWDQATDMGGANQAYRVAEFGVFRITHYQKGTSNDPDQVVGKFEKRSESGAFVGGTCTMTCKAAIVR